MIPVRRGELAPMRLPLQLVLKHTSPPRCKRQDTWERGKVETGLYCKWPWYQKTIVPLKKVGQIVTSIRISLLSYIIRLGTFENTLQIDFLELTIKGFTCRFKLITLRLFVWISSGVEVGRFCLPSLDIRVVSMPPNGWRTVTAVMKQSWSRLQLITVVLFGTRLKIPTLFQTFWKVRNYPKLTVF